MDPENLPATNVIVYYAIIGISAALVGFITSHAVIHFYDCYRQQNKSHDKVIAQKVALGIAIAFALIGVFLKRVALGGP